MATKLTLKELAKKEDRLAPGHRLCAGCGASIVVRQMLAAIDDPVVLGNATLPGGGNHNLPLHGLARAVDAQRL